MVQADPDVAPQSNTRAQSDIWGQLHTAARRRTLFPMPPRAVPQRAGAWLLVPSRAQYALAAALMAVAAAAFASRLLPGIEPCGVWFLAAIGAVLVGAAIWLLVRWAAVLLDPANRRVRFKLTRGGTWQDVSVDGLTAALSERRPPRWLEGQRVELVLLRDTQGVRVAAARRLRRLQRLYDLLHAAVGAGTTTDGMARLTAPDGAVVRYSRQPLFDEGASFRASQLRLRSQDVAVTVPTWKYRLFFLLFGATAGAVATAALLSPLPWWVRLLAAAFGYALAVVGLAGVLGRMTRWARIDRTQGVWLSPPLRAGLSTPGPDIRAEDMMAAQICRLYVAGGDSEGGPSYWAYQLNLVCRGEDRRVCLLCHADEPALRRDGRRLAAFLHVPLVDHVEPKDAPEQHGGE